MARALALGFVAPLDWETESKGEGGLTYTVYAVWVPIAFTRWYIRDSREGGPPLADAKDSSSPHGRCRLHHVCSAAFPSYSVRFHSSPPLVPAFCLGLGCFLLLGAAPWFMVGAGVTSGD